MRTSEIPLFEGSVPPEASAIFFMPQVSGDEKLRRVPKSFFGGEQGPPGEDGTNGTDGAPGTNGTSGTDGSNGSNGTNGAAGAVWRSGVGAPANGLGVNGDFYLEIVGGAVYEKSGGTYSIVANIQGPAGAPGVPFTHSTLTYAATVDIDFDSDDYRTLTLTGNVTFTTSNRAVPRAVSVRIIGDGSSRTLAFPAGWIFLGAAAPTALAANKIAILSVTCFGANDSDVVAAYSAQI